jgi:Ni/Co efflux regulator RcnB
MRFVKQILLIALIVIPCSLAAQDGKKVRTKKARKEAVKKQSEHKDQLVSDYSKRADHHEKIQDKSTRKRMKKNQKRVKRRYKGTEIPFYKRWFRKKHFK